MPHHYAQPSVNILISDLRALTGPAVNDKLIYLDTKLTDIDNAGLIYFEYCYEDFDIIAEIEMITISKMVEAENKAVSLQLYLSPWLVIVHLDRVFLQQILSKLLSQLLESVQNGSVISIHITDCDGKCMVEGINRSAIAEAQITEDYFKKYRINNSLQNHVASVEDTLSVYKQITEDMGGELIYNFTNKSEKNYFRLKCILA